MYSEFTGRTGRDELSCPARSRRGAERRACADPPAVPVPRVRAWIFPTRTGRCWCCCARTCSRPTWRPSGAAILSPAHPAANELLRLLAAGHTNAQIARQLGISEGTVRTHLENIYQKLGVSSRTAAVTRALPDRIAQDPPGADQGDAHNTGPHYGPSLPSSRWAKRNLGYVAHQAEPMCRASSGPRHSSASSARHSSALGVIRRLTCDVCPPVKST